jgi:hypothetical protein
MSNEHDAEYDDPEAAQDSGDSDDGPRRNQLVRRSFEGVATLMNNSATQALTAKATADINARWMIAMHRPRQMPDVRDAILHECKRPNFARAAIYAVPRGDGKIKGLTIRFAEAAMKAMGNMGCEAQTLYDSADERVVRVTVTDYEGNTAWSRDLTIRKVKEVKKQPARHLGVRLNSYGDVVYTVPASDDDVNTKESAAISKASRTGILRLIPAWLLAEAREKCETVQKDAAAKDPDAERRIMLDAFSELNVKPSWLSEWLGHPAEAATPAQVVELQQLYRAIRDGHTTPDEALRSRRGDKSDKPTGGVVAAAVARGDRKSKTPATPHPAASSEPPDEEKREIARIEREAAKEGPR